MTSPGSARIGLSPASPAAEPLIWRQIAIRPWAALADRRTSERGELRLELTT